MFLYLEHVCHSPIAVTGGYRPECDTVGSTNLQMHGHEERGEITITWHCTGRGGGGEIFVVSVSKQLYLIRLDNNFNLLRFPPPSPSLSLTFYFQQWSSKNEVNLNARYPRTH